MKFNAMLNVVVVAFFVAMASPSIANEEIPDVTIDGLHHVKNTNLATVYAQPGIDLGQYRRIHLDDAHIAFKKNWRRDQNRGTTNKVSTRDMSNIKAELASLFREVFSNTLEESGYELATGRAEDVLLIKPAIINLDIVAPDTGSMVNTRTYTESAGEMTLYLELYDSITGDLIAKALDRQKDRQTGYFQWQNRISNRAAANRILQVWADVLKEGLDEARRSGQTP